MGLTLDPPRALAWNSILQVSDFTAFDDSNQPLHGLEITQPVTVYDDDVCKLPCADSSDLSLTQVFLQVGTTTKPDASAPSGTLGSERSIRV